MKDDNEIDLSASARESNSDKIRVTDQEQSDKGIGANVRIIEEQRDDTGVLDMGEEPDLHQDLHQDLHNAAEPSGDEYSDD